jgi:hypothetical protein
LLTTDLLQTQPELEHPATEGQEEEEEGHKMKFRSAVPLLLQLSLPAVLGADTADWRSRTIYFALTDRIARSSSDTGGSACTNLNDYCGGTFQGLESKLDYIKGMGFDAIWINPVVTSELLIYPQPSISIILLIDS